MKVRKALVCIAGVLFLLTMVSFVSHSEVPQQINYQGYLTDDEGNPLDESYSILFTIYDDGGTNLWNETQTVNIVDGNYTVQLGQLTSFPAELFDGDLYLGVKVGSDLEMDPRLPITSVAFAMKADDADTLNGFDSTAFLSTDGGLADLDLNNLLVQGLGSFDNNGEEGILYLGSTNNYIKAVHGFGVRIGAYNADDALAIQDLTGNVGIGVPIPGAKLDVNGTIRSKTGGFKFPDGTTQASAGITSETDPQVGNLTRLYIPTWNGSQLSDSKIYEGLVLGKGYRMGIGTDNPQARLHVNAAHDAEGLILGPPSTEGVGETYRMRIRNGFGDGFLQTASGGPQFLLSYNSFRDNDGTWHATYPAYQSAMVNLSPGTIRFQTGTSANNPDVTTHMKIQSDGHVHVGSDTKYLSMFTTGSLVDLASEGSSLAINFNNGNDTVLNVTGGRVGIGSSLPTSKLYVKTTAEEAGIEAWTSSPNEWHNAIFGANTGQGSGVYGGTSSTLTTEAGVYATNGGAGPGIIATAGSEGYAGVFYGSVAVKVLEITGADLSEQYTVRGTHSSMLPTPGKVVSIDPENPGDLVVSHAAYDRKVAGIISGAGNIPIGMLMGKEGKGPDGKNPVALTGRVYCLVDASNGAIEPGDLLTTSNVPGHAMKVTDYPKAQGAILGKAMSSLEGGQGLVLILVTLQ